MMVSQYKASAHEALYCAVEENVNKYFWYSKEADRFRQPETRRGSMRQPNWETGGFVEQHLFKRP
jgi:hypothetical protein